MRKELLTPNPADGQGKRLQLTFGSESQESLLDLGKYSFWGTGGETGVGFRVNGRRGMRTVIVDKLLEGVLQHITENDVEDDGQLGQESVLVRSLKQQHVYMPVRTFQQPGGK